MKIPVTH